MTRGRKVGPHVWKQLAKDSVLLLVYDSQKVLKSTDWTEDFHLKYISNVFKLNTFKYS